MTEVARIAAQIKMMRGPPLAIVSRMVCDSAGARGLSCCLLREGSRRKKQQPEANKGARQVQFDFLHAADHSGNDDLLFFDENVSTFLRFGNSGSIVVEESNSVSSSPAGPPDRLLHFHAPFPSNRTPGRKPRFSQPARQQPCRLLRRSAEASPWQLQNPFWRRPILPDQYPIGRWHLGRTS